MSKSNETIEMERRDSSDRRDRDDSDRRQQDLSVDGERRGDERRKVQRRRKIDPTTCERDYSQDEIAFMTALDQYKRDSGRMFPTCSEILEVIRGLGYLRLDESGVPVEAPLLAQDGAESAMPNDEAADEDEDLIV